MENRRCMKCMHALAAGETVCPECGRPYGSVNTESFALKPGTILDGKYLVGEMLGQGGFGITYIGFDLLLEQKVAIKEYFPMSTGMVSRENRSTVVWSSAMVGKTGTQRGFDSFLKEARKMAKLGGIPNVVGVKSVFTQNETAYIVMDFIEGETLQQKMQKNGPMDFDSCIRLMTPIMQSLAEVHKHGIIHRDISPDNIMVQPDGKPVLLDLGAAKDLAINKGASSAMVVKGGFSPPEQYAQQGGSGSWTDVYAMAATMYHSLTGVVPPTAVDRMQGEPVNWALLETGGVPNHVIAALQNAMKLSARERTQTMAELLSQCQSKSAHASRPGANHSGSQKKANAVVIGLAVALCAMTAVLVTLFVKAKPEPQPAPTKTVVQAEPTVSHVEPTIAYTKPTAPSSNQTKPTASTVPEETQAKKPAVNVNDIVSFGHYEQDGNRSNGAEAIEWLVLDVQEDRALLLSRYALDAQPFHKKYEYVTWDTSTIRQWLNGTFYNSAFSEDEKTIMERTTLLPDRNPYIKCDSGRETADYVFLLSLEEVDAFIQSNGNIDKDALLCYPTDYAVQQGTYKNKDTGGCWWWLRTSADDNLAVCSVNSDTIIDYHDGTVNSPKAGVRPAIWVSIG